MLMFLFWMQKNKLKIIIKLHNQASPHLDPIEKVTTKLLKAGYFELNHELNQATKIITINPKDIHSKDLDNNFDFTSIAWILYFEKKLLDIFSINTPFLLLDLFKL